MHFFNEKNKNRQEEKTLTHKKMLNCVLRTQFRGGGRARDNCEAQSPEAVSATKNLHIRMILSALIIYAVA